MNKTSHKKFLSAASRSDDSLLCVKRHHEAVVYRNTHVWLYNDSLSVHIIHTGYSEGPANKRDMYEQHATDVTLRLNL